MPHKRAKRSVRELQRTERGSDLAPTGQRSLLADEALPKSLTRVLNAASVREQYTKNKRRADGEGGDDEGRPTKKQKKTTGKDKDKDKEPKILPGESLQHFNKRIEQDMRPLVRNAVQSSQALTRKVKAEEIARKKAKAQANSKVKAKEPSRSPSPSLPSLPSPPPKPIKEFQTTKTSARRRLNDIAQAPPEFKLGATKMSSRADEKAHGKKSDGVLSMAQRAMMDVERGKAIARYRELKESRREAQAAA